MPPVNMSPDIGSVCSFKHLLLRLCLSQRAFFFFFSLLLVEWWDAYFGRLHCGYPSETLFTYLWREYSLNRPCFAYCFSSPLWWFRMRKTDNAIIMLHSVVSHTMKKKRWHSVSARVLCPFSIRFQCLWRSHVWQWTSHHWSQRIPFFLLFFLEFVRTPSASSIACWPPLEKNALCRHCASRNALPMLQLKFVGQLLCEACNRRMPPSLRPRQCPSVRRRSVQILVISFPRGS